MADALYDPMQWRRGTTFYQPWQMGNGRKPFDLTGSELVFRVIDSAGNEYLRASTEDADSGFTISDPENGLCELDLDFSITRNAPTRGLNYSVERRIGSNPQTQEVLFYGPLKIVTDANDDG